MLTCYRWSDSRSTAGLLKCMCVCVCEDYSTDSSFFLRDPAVRDWKSFQAEHVSGHLQWKQAEVLICCMWSAFECQLNSKYDECIQYERDQIKASWRENTTCIMSRLAQYEYFSHCIGLCKPLGCWESLASRSGIECSFSTSLSLLLYFSFTHYTMLLFYITEAWPLLQK